MDSITAIILCGGQGTRLRSISGQLPKPMVSVAERPFLEYILDYLIGQGVKNAVLAVSYQKDVIIEHFGSKYRSLDIAYSVESSPLGTGGAIKYAMEHLCHLTDQLTLVINGDTLVEYDLTDMYAKSTINNADLVMSLISVEDTSRYGRVNVRDGRITDFEEKKSGHLGLINAGAYLFHSRLCNELPPQSSFSFEREFLDNVIHTHNVLPSISDGYFIDIGVPEDYRKAQLDFTKFNENVGNA
ncbi:nucleotidyltransferase family protein [Vibrio alfacsensis]|uniref:nucleotidyltransferase family protein n=1 Tax=Vibrio alfacsensis TaxID=1074311 RepID=UPI004069845C